MSTWSATIRARVGALDLDVSLSGDARPLALIGPNGSGKTTLMRALAGAIDTDEVEVEVAGRILASTSRGVHVPMEARRIGYVPQGYGLFPHLDVLDNVAFGLSTGPRRKPRRERHRRARALLEELDCAALARRRVTHLSGGEQQRVSLARALVIEPELLLLDEPLAALDATVRRTVRDFLTERLRAFGRPAVLVTHDMRDVVALGATVAVMDRGRIVASGALDELRSAPNCSDFLAEFAG